ncbi:rRNA-processing protein cgr1 [Teratosphaeriaceae sp. CCFEE 6253]|nr:rRNA-processing protein cgr1 [Teratosphaeriaceae sp. CCFEE 6253]
MHAAARKAWQMISGTQVPELANGKNDLIKIPVARTALTAIMATTVAQTPVPASEAVTAGLRKNGKQWHETRKAFRPTAGQTPYAKRAAKQAQEAEVKKLETEMKAEKEEERQRRIQAIKDKRAAKEEKERFERMALKMHAKRVERLRRREKRNKLLKS